MLSHLVPITLHLSTGYLALVRKIQAAVGYRFAQLRVHELVDVQTHALPRTGRQIENSRVHSNRILGTDFNTVSTVDANTQVDVKADGIFLDVRVGMFPGNDGDALGRANRFTEHASHTSRGVIVT